MRLKEQLLQILPSHTVEEIIEIISSRDEKILGKNTLESPLTIAGVEFLLKESLT